MENAPKPPLWIQLYVLMKDPHGNAPTEIEITDLLGTCLIGAMHALKIHVGNTDWYVQLAHYEDASTLEDDPSEEEIALRGKQGQRQRGEPERQPSRHETHPANLGDDRSDPKQNNGDDEQNELHMSPAFRETINTVLVLKGSTGQPPRNRRSWPPLGPRDLDASASPADR